MAGRMQKVLRSGVGFEGLPLPYVLFEDGSVVIEWEGKSIERFSSIAEAKSFVEKKTGWRDNVVSKNGEADRVQSLRRRWPGSDAGS